MIIVAAALTFIWTLEPLWSDCASFPHPHIDTHTHAPGWLLIPHSRGVLQLGVKRHTLWERRREGGGAHASASAQTGTFSSPEPSRRSQPRRDDVLLYLSLCASWNQLFWVWFSVISSVGSDTPGNTPYTPHHQSLSFHRWSRKGGKIQTLEKGFVCWSLEAECLDPGTLELGGWAHREHLISVLMKMSALLADKAESDSCGYYSNTCP